MAEKKKTAQVAPKYPKEELLTNTEALFNVRREVLAGALHGNEQTEFTVDEMKKLIDSFLKRKVNN